MKRGKYKPRMSRPDFTWRGTYLRSVHPRIVPIRPDSLTEWMAFDRWHDQHFTMLEKGAQSGEKGVDTASNTG